MIVVDASVWVSYLLQQDSNHKASRTWLNGYIAGGGKVVAPTILLAELAGAIARRTGDSILAQQLVAAIISLPELSLVDIDQTLSLAAAQIAADLKLRGADSFYVALAQALQIPLVTLDQEQLTRPIKIIQTQTP